MQHQTLKTINISKASNKSISIVGARGVGKSKLSKLLSFETKYNLYSLDSLITYENNGLSIEDIVKRQGWENFRNIEYEVLKKVTKLKNYILDCGGGVIIDYKKNNKNLNKSDKIDKKNNIKKSKSFDKRDIKVNKIQNENLTEIFSKRKYNLLKKSSDIIYLEASIESLVKLNVKDKNRPQLIGDYEKLLLKRLDYYKKISNYTINMDEYSVEEALKLIIRKYF